MTDKANALEQAHGLWRRAFAAMQKEYPDVQGHALYVDVCAMELVRAPERFDVIVTSNLFGDILTDLGAGIAGGLGLAASANIHPGQVSLFEPVHGSAPDPAGPRLVPTAAQGFGVILTGGGPFEVAVAVAVADHVADHDHVHEDAYGKWGRRWCGGGRRGRRERCTAASEEPGAGPRGAAHL